jgi:hypothetical protein
MKPEKLKNKTLSVAVRTAASNADLKRYAKEALQLLGYCEVDRIQVDKVDTPKR